jgi:hypothetical protein
MLLRKLMVRLNSMSKVGQAWGMDLMIATMIFSVALVTFYLYSFNATSGGDNKLEDLSFNGRLITNILLSSGFPEDWTEADVVEMGIMTDDKIDDLKLSRFYNFSRDNYSETKNVFNTNYDYYFFLDENMTIDSIVVDGIGKPGVDRYNITSRNLIRVERVVVYRNKPVGAKLYLWD